MKHTKKIFLLLGTFFFYNQLPASIDTQLKDLTTKLEGLKGKLGVLQKTLNTFKKNLHVKKPFKSKEVAAAAASADTFKDFFATKIIPHIHDKNFTKSAQRSFEKLPEDTLVAIETNLNDELKKTRKEADVEQIKKVSSIVLEAHEKLIEKDINSDDYDKAREKIKKMYNFEVNYATQTLNREQRKLIKAIEHTASMLTVDQLKSVLTVVTKNFEKLLVIDFIKMALSVKNNFDVTFRQKLAHSIIRALDRAINSKELKNILEKEALAVLYKKQACTLLKNGINDGVDALGKATLSDANAAIINFKVRQIIMPGYKNLKDDGAALKQMLINGLSDEIIQRVIKYCDSPANAAAHHLYQNIYEKFTQEEKQKNNFKQVLFNNVCDDVSRRLLASNILKALGYGDTSKDWDAPKITLPMWFNDLNIPDAVIKNILVVILQNALSKSFEKSYKKLELLDPVIKSILIPAELETQIDQFLKNQAMKSPKSARLSGKIDREEAAYRAREEAEERKRSRRGSGLTEEAKKALEAVRRRMGWGK